MNVYVGEKAVGSILDGYATIVLDARAARAVIPKMQKTSGRVYYRYEHGVCILRVPSRDFEEAFTGS